MPFIHKLQGRLVQSVNPYLAIVMTSRAQAFVELLRRWIETGDETSLARAMRSPYSGVPHDAAAAYATLARRTGSLLDAIARGRIGVPAGERDALIDFAERVRSLDSSTEIGSVFDLTDRAIAGAGEPAPFALAPANARDPRAGIRSHQSHFSASALNAYAECPRKWYYRYVCAAVEDAPSSASTYGTAFHAALEDFHGEFPHPEASLEAAMRDRIAGYVNWTFERFRDDFGSAVEVELNKRRALRTAQRYVDWLVEAARRAPFTVVGREEQASLDLDGFAFVGFIDRIDRDDATGAIAIIDYKTGTIATTAAEYRDKVRTFRDFQLPFYYWARTELGDRVSRLALIPLKDAMIDIRPVALEVVPVAHEDARRSTAAAGTIAIADLERARTKMIEICRELKSGTIEQFPVATDATACTYCAYALACVDRPREERKKFGR
jgi:RecB family exonuclease